MALSHMFCNLKIDEKEAEMKKNESESYMDTVRASGAVVERLSHHQKIFYLFYFPETPVTCIEHKLLLWRSLLALQIVTTLSPLTRI